MDDEDAFLPDFCRLSTLARVLVIVQLLVFLLVLAQPAANRWWLLSLFTLYIQWVALGSCLVLCLLRHRLKRLTVLPASLVAGAVIIAVSAVVTEVAWQGVGGGEMLSAAHLGFHARAAAMAAIVAGLMLHYFHLQRAWRRQWLAQTQARLHALESRIRPHFLFNSLNTIASMIRRRPQQAEQAVEDLAALFRAGLGAGSGLRALSQELELARDYLRLEALRLEERLRVHWDVEGLPADAALPPLTLQPLLENAVYHGIEPLPEGGEIRVVGERRGEQLRLTITNPVPARGELLRSAGMGMALDNVRQRLQLAFGSAAYLHATREKQRYNTALVFPYRRIQTWTS